MPNASFRILIAPSEKIQFYFIWVFYTQVGPTAHRKCNKIYTEAMFKNQNVTSIRNEMHDLCYIFCRIESISGVQAMVVIFPEQYVHNNIMCQHARTALLCLY